MTTNTWIGSGDSATMTMADVAPSTRVPVVPGNKALLRFLRSVELEAWEEGGAARTPWDVELAKRVGLPGLKQNRAPRDE